MMGPYMWQFHPNTAPVYDGADPKEYKLDIAGKVLILRQSVMELRENLFDRPA
jgi:hypothetical protein